MWQAEAGNVSSLSALPATAMGQILLEYGTQKIGSFENVFPFDWNGTEL